MSDSAGRNHWQPLLKAHRLFSGKDDWSNVTKQAPTIHISRQALSRQSRMVGNNLHWGKPIVVQQWASLKHTGLSGGYAAMIEPPINMSRHPLKELYIFGAVVRNLDTNSKRVICFLQVVQQTCLLTSAAVWPPQKNRCNNIKNKMETEEHQTFVKI